VGLVHPSDDDQPRECGEGGDGVDGGLDGDEVGEHTGEQRSDGEAGVTPQAIHADRAGAPRWVRDVTDRGEQRRVHHRRAGAEQCGAGRPRPETGRGGDQRDGGRLGEHATRDEGFAADPVGQPTRDELPETPHRGVDRGEHTDPCDRETGVREEDREESPREPVVEVVDEPGL
jgi:hypothetical protein